MKDILYSEYFRIKSNLYAEFHLFKTKIEVNN